MIKIFKGKDGQWYVHHTSQNGKILCVSEGFKTRASAVKNIRAMLKIYKVVARPYKDETTGKIYIL